MPEFSPLEDQIRECFGRVIYTHKTHEKMAEQCAATLRNYKLAQIIVSAATALSALLTDAKNVATAKLITAGFSAITIWLTGYIKGFDPGGSAQKHRDTAANLWPIREAYLSLLADLRMGAVEDKDAMKRRDQMESKVAAIYKGAPQTNAKAYKAAQKALKEDEEYTFSDAELNKFMPASLRKKTE